MITSTNPRKSLETSLNLFENQIRLGEIGFKHEIDLFRKDDNNAGILYYPNEYFNELEEDIEQISSSFDIWSLGVVFWEILTKQKLFTNQKIQHRPAFVQH